MSALSELHEYFDQKRQLAIREMRGSEAACYLHATEMVGEYMKERAVPYKHGTHECGEVIGVATDRPRVELNREIAHSIGWKTWSVERGGEELWFQERPSRSEPGMLDVAPLFDYVESAMSMDLPLAVERNPLSGLWRRRQ